MLAAAAHACGTPPRAQLCLLCMLCTCSPPPAHRLRAGRMLHNTCPSTYCVAPARIRSPFPLLCSPATNFPPPVAFHRKSLPRPFATPRAPLLSPTYVAERELESSSSLPLKQPPSALPSMSARNGRDGRSKGCHCQGFRVLILYIDGGPSPVLCCSASRPATAHAHDTTESTEDEPMSVSRLQKCAAAACHQNVKCFHRLTPSAVHFAKAFTLRAGTPRSKSSAAARSALYT